MNRPERYQNLKELARGSKFFKFLAVTFVCLGNYAYVNVIMRLNFMLRYMLIVEGSKFVCLLELYYGEEQNT